MEKRERGEHRGETNHGRKRRETIEAEEKNGAKEKGGDAASLQGASLQGASLQGAPRGHLAEV